MPTVIIIKNINTNQYFFTTDHCQDHNLGVDWVPVTYYDTEEYAVMFLNKSMQRISNPDPMFDPDFIPTIPEGWRQVKFGKKQSDDMYYDWVDEKFYEVKQLDTPIERGVNFVIRKQKEKKK